MNISALKTLTNSATPGIFARNVSGGRWRMAQHHALFDRELCDVASGKNKRLIIQTPPRHGKSEIVSRYFPAWYVGTFPERNVILTSATDELALDFSGGARDVMIEHGADYFGAGVNPDRRAAHRWQLDSGAMVRAAGVGGSIMGRGADLLIIDDYIKNIEEALSETQRRKVHQWFFSTSKSRLSPEGAIVIVATRWHADDLVGRLLKEQDHGGDEWRVVRLPALAEADDPLGREVGEALWPGQWSREYLERMRSAYVASGYEWMWEALYQQNPPLTLDAEFDAKWFGDDIMFDDYPPPERICFRVVYLDPSLGRTDKSDYSAFVMIALDWSGDMWIDADIQRRNAVRMVEDGMELGRRWHADAFGVESNGFQEVLADIYAEKSKASGLQLPLRLLQHNTNKLTRVRAGLTPYLARGDMHFKRHSPGVSLLLEQLKAFPASKHDDGPDALEGALSLIKLLYLTGRSTTNDSAPLGLENAGRLTHG